MLGKFPNILIKIVLVLGITCLVSHVLRLMLFPTEIHIYHPSKGPGELRTIDNVIKWDLSFDILGLKKIDHCESEMDLEEYVNYLKLIYPNEPGFGVHIFIIGIDTKFIKVINETIARKEFNSAICRNVLLRCET